MSFAAPPTSGLFSRLRSSFSAGSSGGLTTSLPNASSSTPVAQSLDVLDQILNQVEAEKAARVASTAKPPESQLTAPVAESVATNQPLTPMAMAPQAVPLAVDQAVTQQTQQFNQTVGSSSAKESLTTTVVGASEQPAAAPLEIGQGLQVVEQEAVPENLPVEVEGFIQEVENHQEVQPHEIVVADDRVQLQAPSLSMKPVVVLPITPDLEEVGEKKNHTWSLRWLVEWSHKLMKMFNGKIIYREA